MSALRTDRKEVAKRGELGRQRRCISKDLLELVVSLGDEACLVADDDTLLVCLGTHVKAQPQGRVAGEDVVSLYFSRRETRSHSSASISALMASCKWRGWTDFIPLP